MTATHSVPIDILLVEDNPGDVRLTREAFREARTQNRLTVAGDGEEAMDMLRRLGPHAHVAASRSSGSRW